MQFREDRRGQAIQIGAVLLLGALVLAFSIYQAVVVPDQNRAVEFKHSQEVQGQLQDLRNAMVSARDGGSRSVSVELGTRYPSRLIALNPPDPSGSIATVGTANATINATVANAAATGETGDYWNGTNRTFNTGAIAYRPGYNEYGSAPVTWYEHSVLYNRFADADLTLTGQRLVDGDRISLVTLNGSLSTSRTGTVSLDTRPVSVSTTTVSVTNETDANLTVTVPTRLNESAWRDLLNGEFVGQGGHIVDVDTRAVTGGEFQQLTVVFERGVTYDLRLARVGVGTGVVRPETAYLTQIGGNGTTVPENGTVQLTVEVRDRLNNPVAGANVYAATQGSESSVTPATGRTDGDGQVTLTYEAPADVSGVSQRTDRINASLNVSAAAVDAADFEPTTPINLTMAVKVDNSDGSGLSSGGGDGAYSVFWTDPTQTGVSCDPAGDPDGVCTVDANATASVDLTASTNPTVDGATVQFALNDSAIGSLSSTNDATDSSGRANTTFSPTANGSVIVYGSSGGSGDQLTLIVENASGNQPPTAVIDSTSTTPNQNNGKRHDVTVTFTGTDPDSDITSYTVTLYDNQADANSGTNIIDTVSNASYAGGQTSVTLRDTDSSKNAGDDPYYVVVTVTDNTSLTGTDEQATADV